MARLWTRILNLLAPVTITGLDDSGGVLRAQVTIGGQVIDDVPVLQQFGLASVPPLNSEGVLACVGGDRANACLVATGDPATRPTGQIPGEKTIYNAFGMAIRLTQNGIVIVPNGQPVLLEGDLHCTGAVIQGYGGADQVGLGTHMHGKNTAPPSPGT